MICLILPIVHRLMKETLRLRRSANLSTSWAGTLSSTKEMVRHPSSTNSSGGKTQLRVWLNLALLERSQKTLPTEPPACPHPGREPDPAHGWQRIACQARDDAESAALLSTLDTAGCALMLSQAGTHASRAFTAFPTALGLEYSICLG